jgi:hypothetical protein
VGISATMGRVALVAALAFAAARPAAPQEDSSRCPRLSHTASGTIRRVWEINLEMKQDPSCGITYVTGVVKLLLYDEENPTTPYAFVVERKDGRREQVGFGFEPVEECLSEADRVSWRAQLVKGAHVRVGSWACGVAGRGDLMAESVEFLPARTRRR